MGARTAPRFAHTASGARVATPYRAAADRAREKRNRLPIHGYTGSNGGGKTMAAVYDSLPTLAAGRPIVSTCRILDPVTGEPHPLWVPLDDFRLVLELGFCDVILDEVTGVASSRDSAGMPSAVLNHLMQLRKADVTVRWTTPNWRRADVGIREVTQGLTTCIGLMPTTVTEVTDDGLVRRWRPRRMFSWKTYDAQSFDEWSAAKEKSSSKAHRLRPTARQVFWGPGAIVRDCYDTYEHALTLGVVSDRGLCMDCGAARPAKRCQCDKRDKDGNLVHEPTHDDTPGMVKWRALDAARRNPQSAAFDRYVEEAEDRDELGALAGNDRLVRKYVADVSEPVLIPETDDTPAVLLDPTPAL